MHRIALVIAVILTFLLVATDIGGWTFNKNEEVYRAATESNPDDGYWEASRITLAYKKTTSTEITYRILMNQDSLRPSGQTLGLIDFPLRKHKGVVGCYYIKCLSAAGPAGGVVIDSAWCRMRFHLAKVSVADTLRPDSSIYATTYGMFSQDIIAIGDTITNGAFKGTAPVIGTIDLGYDTLSHLWAERLVFTSMQDITKTHSWRALNLDINIVLPFSEAYMRSPEYLANEGRR